MKKHYIILVKILFLSIFAKAQTYYDFQQLTGNYTELQNATVYASFNDDWCSLDKSLPIGFSFSAFSNSADSLFLEQYSCGTFFALRDSGVDYYEDNFLKYSVFSLLYQVSSNPSLVSSSISYGTYGVYPNRILKVQIKDGADDYYISSGSNINVQLWLYEASNIIEFHMGNNVFIEQDTTQRVMFISEYDGDTSYTYPHFVTGDLNSAAVKRFDYVEAWVEEPIYDSVLYFNNPTSTSGLIYRFSPHNSTSIKESNSSKLEIYPNPSFDKINLSGFDNNGDKYFKIITIQGKIVMEVKLDTSSNSIDLSHLNKSTYLLNIYNERESLNKIFIKQ